MKLEATEVAFLVIESLKALMPRIKRHDRSLADQLSRAASSMVLNASEAEYSDPGTRRSRFHSAAGSANETRAALRLAVAWGHVTAREAERPLALLDRVVAMLWKLTH